MRAIYSYGVALVIVLVLAVWLATGTLINGGHGPGNGEKPVVSLIEKNGGPLTNAVEKSGINKNVSSEGIDPAQTIAERTDATGNGASAAPRSVRIAVLHAQPMSIDVPLRGRTKASSVLRVVAQTTGIVPEVDVKKGQVVKAGDTMCVLDKGARQLSVDQANAAVQQAQTAFESNQSLVQKGLAAQNTALAAQSALASAKTALEQAQLELDRATIKASASGTVSDPVATVGALLAIGTPCATVVQLDPMLFIASVPEAKVGYARLGLSADITTVTGDKAEGKVTYIAPTADDATRSFPIEISIPNPAGKIRDGVTADADVVVGTAPAHVPPQSVLTLDDSGVLGIRTVEDGNKVAFHAINIVKDTREGVWVVGLPETISVITVGQEFVQPGQIVDAKTDPTPIGATADGSEKASASAEQPA